LATLAQTHTFCTTQVDKNVQNRTFYNGIGGWLTGLPTWASERGALPPLVFWKFQQKKVVFSISRGKNQISPLVAPAWKKSFRRPWLQILYRRFCRDVGGRTTWLQTNSQHYCSL